MPDFIAHPEHGLGALSLGQKLRIAAAWHGARISLSPAIRIAESAPAEYDAIPAHIIGAMAVTGGHGPTGARAAQ